MLRDDFGVLILSHGRANDVKTWRTLDRIGYTGKRYIVIDDQDDQEERYRELYGDHVIMFDKMRASRLSDVMDNDTDMRIVLYARNSCFEIAEELGLTYFLELDDDYTTFDLRYADKGKLRAKTITDMDALCEQMIEFLEVSGAKTVAFAQAGDFVGGLNGGRWAQGLARKAMNSFFCKVDRPFKFLGRINEDVNAYTMLGSRGDLFFTVTRVALVQTQTQAAEHGLTDVYLKYGTYVKSFYSVMCCPSAVKVKMMQTRHPRVHHEVRWNNCCPMIISDRYKRAKDGEEKTDTARAS